MDAAAQASSREEARIKRNARQREWRKSVGNSDTKKYEKTKRGFLVRCYRNMLSRVTGIQKKKAHIYMGLPILPRSEFYEMALADPKFHALFAAWESGGHDISMTPSPDRIDDKVGYLRSNIQWLTHSENSIKANKDRSK